MRKTKNKMHKKTKNKELAFFQIILLIVGMIAFAYMFGGGTKIVSADEPDGSACSGDETKCKDDGQDLSVCVNKNWTTVSCNGLGCANGKCNEETQTEDICEKECQTFGVETCMENNAGEREIHFCENVAETNTCTLKWISTGRPCGEVSNTGANTGSNTFGKVATGVGTLGGLGTIGTQAKNLFTSKAATGTEATGTEATATGTGTGDLGNHPDIVRSNTNPENLNIEPKNKPLAENTKIPFFKTFVGRAVGIYAAAFAAAYGYVAVFKLAGASDRNIHALSSAARIIATSVGTAITVLSSIATTSTAVALGGATVYTTLFAWVGVTAAVPGVGWVAAAIVIIAMAIYTFASYQNYSAEVFTYTVQVWSPPKAGENCLECNDLRYGCSEYQCRTFGQACEIINKGTTQEKCSWENPNDIQPPIITPMESVLKEDYEYSPSDVVSPGERGVKINYKGGCVPAFSELTLGLNTDELAECKIDLERKSNYSEMNSYMSEGPINVYNHTLVLPPSLTPTQSALTNGNTSLEDGLEYIFFIRCSDTNGNPSPLNFVMQFCVEDGPDTKAPIIKSTNYLNPAYISFNQTSAPLEVYTDEPADCKWDFQDLSYDSMNYNMSECSQDLSDFLYAQNFIYGCRTELTGLKSNQDNEYYIKCKDQPWMSSIDPGKRNENKQSYELNLIGTLPLVISEVTINGLSNGSVIKDSTNTIKVLLEAKTSGGSFEGLARCQYQINERYYDFFNEGSFEYFSTNTQSLWLSEGDYTYAIKCIDKGGNPDYANISFSVETDLDSPTVVRAYHEEGYLKLITDEPAECVYSNIGCNYEFEDGSAMTSANNTAHFLEWVTDNDLYVKCMDKYGNEPTPQDVCSIIVRGSDFYSIVV